MRVQTDAARTRQAQSRRGWIIGIVVIVVVVAAMALDTKVVKQGVATADSGVFKPAQYGNKQFPKTQKAVEQHAVDAVTLAKAIGQNQDDAAKKYGVAGDMGPEMSVKFTGIAGKGDSGIYPVTIPGLPASIMVRVQTGPAINGTSLRDATGTVKFGQFKNQIDYQNAGAALNQTMKKSVLSKVDAAKLAGKTISVVGVFTLINPNNWFVTPVALSVK